MKPMALDSPENIPGLTERIYIAHRTMRLRRRTTGEHIILAGETRQGIEGLVEAIHRHKVGRVILTFTRIELATHEPKPLQVPTPFSCLLQ
jgi:hypothetical protein